MSKSLKVVIDLDLLETLVNLSAYRLGDIADIPYSELDTFDRSVITEAQFAKLQELTNTLQR